MKGQINISVALIAGIVTVATSLIGAYVTANGTIYGVKQDVAIVQERENNHYMELKESLLRIEKKIDILSK